MQNWSQLRGFTSFIRRAQGQAVQNETIKSRNNNTILSVTDTVGLAGTRSWYSTIHLSSEVTLVQEVGTAVQYNFICLLSVNFQMNCRVWSEGFSNYGKINDCRLKLDSQIIRSFKYQLICFKIQNSKPFN